MAAARGLNVVSAQEARPTAQLRSIRPTRRGAVDGFPLRQLPRRLAALLASGRNVTFVGHRGQTGQRILQRGPEMRWVVRRLRSRPEP